MEEMEISESPDDKQTTIMEADTTHTDPDDDDDGIERYIRRMGLRHMPKEMIQRFKDMELPEKMLRRYMFFGPIEDMEELMEIESKIRRREHGSSSASSTSSAYERPVYMDGAIPQTQPLNDRQVRNNAGGYGYQVDDMTRLRRLLCLGTEGGTYYVKEKELGRDNLQVVSRMLDQHKGEDVVLELTKFEGRVAKQNAMILVLAMCARHDHDLKAKRAAYKALPKICGIPTHLFTFIEYCQNITSGKEGGGTGWGRAHRIGIVNWYLSYKETPAKLAMQVTKYRQRNGWTHRDVMRLSHPKPQSDRVSEGLALVLKYIVKGLDVTREAYAGDDASEEVKKLVRYLEAVEEVRALPKENIDEACELIKKHRLVREHLNTEMLNSPKIWTSLLQNMPMMAMIRNLGKMTNIGLLEEGTKESSLVIEKLTNENTLKYAKIHPFNVLLAIQTYKSGHGDKGSLAWKVNPGVTRALEDAFYKSFKYVQPTMKRFLLALDVSASMGSGQVNGCNIVPRDAAAAMSMVTARTEPHHEIVGFESRLVRLNINAEQSLSDVIREVQNRSFGSTDCSQPMLWAAAEQKQFDVFIVYTDSETWSGSVHVTEALKRYRTSMNVPDAKLIVVALTSTGFTIADPNDKYMLDVVGFDSSVPEIINNFALGKI